MITPLPCNPVLLMRIGKTTAELVTGIIIPTVSGLMSLPLHYFEHLRVSTIHTAIILSTFERPIPDIPNLISFPILAARLTCIALGGTTWRPLNNESGCAEGGASVTIV